MELNQDTIKKLRGLILFTVIVVVAGINYTRLLDVAAALFNMAWLFILGAAIAFILNVPMRNIERHLIMFRDDSRLRRPVSLVVTILLVSGVLFLVTFVVTPQLLKTFMALQSSVPLFFAGVHSPNHGLRQPNRGGLAADFPGHGGIPENRSRLHA